MDTGALIKDYEDAQNEDFAPVQLAVQNVAFEDERYLEQAAPPLEQEYPVGSRAIFLGAQTYGVAAQVSEVKDNAMTVTLAVSPSLSYHIGVIVTFDRAVLPRRDQGELCILANRTVPTRGAILASARCFERSWDIQPCLVKDRLISLG